MFKYNKILLTLIFLVTLFYVINVYLKDDNKIITEITDKTIITPVLETKIELDKNIIYCSTMQLAWNKLCNDIIKGTLEIENQSFYVKKLNEFMNEVPKISDDSYVAMAGLGGENIIQKIKEALLAKFNVLPEIDLLNIDSNEILAFSYLQKYLAFEKEFNSFGSNMNFGTDEIKIKSFGIRYSPEPNDTPLKKQVEILYYDWSKEVIGDFIIELKTTSLNDKIIISTVKPEATLLKTYEKIQMLVQKYPNENHKTNPQIPDEERNRTFFITLAIPKINFNINHIYSDFSNQKIKNTNYYLKNIVQNICFNLNEKGAKLKSVTYMECKMGSPLKLNVRGPFIIILKNKTSDFPYFMAYLGNDELLERQSSIMEKMGL